MARRTFVCTAICGLLVVPLAVLYGAPPLRENGSWSCHALNRSHSRLAAVRGGDCDVVRGDVRPRPFRRAEGASVGDRASACHGESTVLGARRHARHCVDRRARIRRSPFRRDRHHAYGHLARRARGAATDARRRRTRGVRAGAAHRAHHHRLLSMPLGIAALDEYYGIATTVDPRHLARQVLAAQLLPLGLGVLARHFWHARIRPFEPAIRKLASLLLLALVVLVLIDVWETIGGAGLRVAAAVIAITMLSLAAGHGLGGPDPTTRTATAIFSGARNAGLALLVATLNDAAAPVVAAGARPSCCPRSRSFHMRCGAAARRPPRRHEVQPEVMLMAAKKAVKMPDAEKCD